MRLNQFPAAMNAAVPAVIAAGAALRYIRDTRGDLTWASIYEVQRALHNAKATCLAALAEAQKAPAEAEPYLAGLGGPQTIAAFGTGMAACEAAAQAWSQRLGGWISERPASDLRRVVRIDTGGVATAQIEDVPFVSEVAAAPLRTSSELSALIAAFEAVGA